MKDFPAATGQDEVGIDAEIRRGGHVPDVASPVDDPELFGHDERHVEITAATDLLAKQAEDEQAFRRLFDQVRLSHASKHIKERRQIDGGEGPALEQHVVQRVGFRPTGFLDRAHDLLNECREVQTFDFRRFAPFLDQQLRHRDGLKQAGKQPVENRGVGAGFLFLDEDANFGYFAFSSSTPAEPLRQGIDRPGRPDLPDGLHTPDVDPHFECAGAEGRDGFPRAEVFLRLLPLSFGKGTVVDAKPVRQSPTFREASNGIRVLFNPILAVGEDERRFAVKRIEDVGQKQGLGRFLLVLVLVMVSGDGRA